LRANLVVRWPWVRLTAAPLCASGVCAPTVGCGVVYAFAVEGTWIQQRVTWALSERPSSAEAMLAVVVKVVGASAD
jgi:hypothetical protein